MIPNFSSKIPSKTRFAKIRKKTQLTSYVFSFAALLLASDSFALVNGQLLLGQRRGNFVSGSESGSVAANVVQAHLLVDPIPLVPVAFGLGLESHSATLPDNIHKAKWTALMAMPEITAWAPIPGDLGLYARLGYVVAGAAALKATVTPSDASEYTIAGKYKPSGMVVGVGVSYSIIPLVALLFEAQMADYKFAKDKVTVGESDFTSSSESPTYRSIGAVVGLEVGI